MEYANIKLTKVELLRIVTLLNVAREEYKEALRDEDYTIYLIAREWLEDMNAVIDKLDNALDECYKAPF